MTKKEKEDEFNPFAPTAITSDRKLLERQRREIASSAWDEENPPQKRRNKRKKSSGQYNVNQGLEQLELLCGLPPVASLPKNQQA